MIGVKFHSLGHQSFGRMEKRGHQRGKKRKRNLPPLSYPNPGLEFSFFGFLFFSFFLSDFLFLFSFHTQDENYVGWFVGYGIIIWEERAIKEIYQSSFFGKGILSRSQPVFNFSSSFSGFSSIFYSFFLFLIP